MHTEICVINCWCTGISKNCFSPQNSRHVEDFKKLPDRLMQKKSMQQFFNKKKILCLCHLFRVGHKNNVSFLRLSSIRWESHQLAATTMSQLSHHCPFLTCPEFCESYTQHQWRGICWVKTRPKFCESWYHSISGRSFEVPFGQLNIVICQKTS